MAGFGDAYIDFCRVLCVTHDQRLAEELASLSEEDRFNGSVASNAYLISHSHGMSKRISFGKVIRIGGFVNQEYVSRITLKQGLQFRISGHLDNADLIKALDGDEEIEGGDFVGGCGCCCWGSGHENERIDRIVVGSHGGSDGVKSFPISSDVDIFCSPYGINVTTQRETPDEGDYISWFKLTEDRWWTLPHNTQFLTESGTKFALTDFGERVKFEFYVQGDLKSSPFLCSDDKVSQAFQDDERYLIFNYTMASCAGSSGAKLYHDLWVRRKPNKFGLAHFGCSEGCNRTGLLSEYDLDRYRHRAAGNDRVSNSDSDDDIRH